MHTKDNAAAHDVVQVGLIHRPTLEDIIRIDGGVFHLRCVDKHGNVEWEVEAHNALTDEGRNLIRDFLFKGGAAIGDSVYLGLSTANLPNNATLATASEATGGAYARKRVTNANWATPGTGQANNTANPATWTASGSAISGVREAFVTNAANGTSGALITRATLPNGPYTINADSTLSATYAWSVT